MGKTNKISNFLKSQSDQAKSLLAIGFGIQIIYIFYSFKGNGYIVDQYGLSIYIARILGEFLGLFLPTLLISLATASIPYYIFRGVATKYKKYLDYVAIIFIVISAILVFNLYNQLDFQETNTINYQSKKA